MKYVDAFRNARNAFRATLAGNYRDECRRPRGDVFMELRNGQTGALELAVEKRNIVTLDASILLARLVKSNLEVPHGAFVLAVGTGDSGWNPLSPPAATNTQRALYGEITRKTFASTQFIDADGVPVDRPTNIVDFTTTFAESEAVGGLVEMGIIGGNIDPNMSIKNPVTPPNGPYDPTIDLTEKETLLNYLVYAIISKPATSTFSVTWRITF